VVPGLVKMMTGVCVAVMVHMLDEEVEDVDVEVADGLTELTGGSSPLPPPPSPPPLLKMPSRVSITATM
jgi:hypothetical protein